MLSAAGWASALHLAAFLVLGWLAGRDHAAGPLRPAVASGGAETPADDESADWLGVVPADPAQLEVPPEPPMGPPLPPADQENRDRAPAALDPGLRQAKAPAPDSGDGPGRKLPPSWRRDSSTLRAHLSNGSDFNQPEHERTASTSSSPQSVRLEKVVGIGDSARTTRPRPTQAAPAADLPAADDNEEVAPALAAETRVSEQTGLHPVRGEGPLDADRGRRSFDLPADGRARDDQTARAASDETQPGLLDYAASATRGPQDGTTGKGAGAAPGVSSQRVTGEAPSPDGWPRPRTAAIEEIGEGTAERQLGREYLEIRRRVAQALRFPKRLALMLEQGEAIVQFMVERDGRVWGDVKLLKSAGFEEFDREALEVVRRAAPFPQLRQRLVVRMRVPFENPIVR
jgi:protein TonB